MFELLKDLPTDDLVEAIYFASRVVKHRDAPDRVGPFESISSEPTKEQATLGRRILDELLRREDTDLEHLSEAGASRVQSDLFALMNQRLSREFGPPSRSKARRLLNKWRQQSGRTVRSG